MLFYTNEKGMPLWLAYLNVRDRSGSRILYFVDFQYLTNEFGLEKEF
jgi:hypothetical protein